MELFISANARTSLIRVLWNTLTNLASNWSARRDLRKDLDMKTHLTVISPPRWRSVTDTPKGFQIDADWITLIDYPSANIFKTLISQSDSEYRFENPPEPVEYRKWRRFDIIIYLLVLFIPILVSLKIHFIKISFFI